MARRVSWTNNSSGHLGTYVYRAPTLDPQSLPVPVATVDPVPQGETAEWIDTEELTDGEYDYAVKDFDGSGVGDLSAVVTHTVGEDYSSAQIGDEIGGGIYAGTITYGDGRQFYIVAAKQSGEFWGGDFSSSTLLWKTTNTETPGAEDPDDGVANMDAVKTAGLADHPAFEYADGYTSDGRADWYLPALNEWGVIATNISATHPEFSSDANNYRWTSTQRTGSFTGKAYVDRVDSSGSNQDKTYASAVVRPIRRIPVNP